MFGDPATPLLKSYAGDPTIIHAFVAPGSEQMHSFTVGGLSFSLDPLIPYSDSLETRGVGPWEMLTAKIIGGAGGRMQEPGDYFYGDLRRVFTKAGMWGLQRVFPRPSVCPAPAGQLRCLPTRPDPPVIGTATPGPAGGARTATITWSPPLSNGSSPITSYRVSALMMDTDGVTPIAPPITVEVGAAARSKVFSLSANTYRFEVVAVNALGGSPPSERSNLVTPQ
ncbi:MAG: fibronectin type III domain-containing protein [Sporichthyaceae bacterium]